MKFGQLPEDELKHVDWELPSDHPDNEYFWGRNETKVFCGCAKWNMKSWIGVHYPEKTRQADFVKEYTKLFNSIELNSTFYRLSRSSIQSWTEEVGDADFTFCPKWSRRVSHLKRLNDVDENIEYFVESCQLFGDKLGPSFLQMPDNFTPKYLDRLVHFFEVLPKGFKVHLELRHPDWFRGAAYEEITALLKEQNQGFVITDVAGRRDVLHMQMTTDEVMIRFNGYGPEEADHHRISHWAHRIKTWKSAGISSIYFFFHHKNETDGPFNAQYLQELI